MESKTAKKFLESIGYFFEGDFWMEEYVNETKIKDFIEMLESYSAQYREENERLKIDLVNEALKTSRQNRQIAELEAELAALRGQNQWISVEERLPEALVNVQVSWYRKEYGDFTTRGYQVAGGLWYIISWDGKVLGANITHWQPLPSPPQTQTKEQK